jgi:hypothetical protein
MAALLREARQRPSRGAGIVTERVAAEAAHV